MLFVCKLLFEKLKIFSILLGCCLFGNEHTNKNVNSAINSLGNFNKTIEMAFEQVILLFIKKNKF